MWGIFMQYVPILHLFLRLRTKLVWWSARPVQQVRTAFIGEMFAYTAGAGPNNEYVFYLFLVVEAQTEVVESWNGNNLMEMIKRSWYSGL